MKIEMSETDDRCTFSVIGQIAGTDIIELCKMIEGRRYGEIKTIVVDLSNVSFIDSHGLGGLVYSHILLEKEKKKLIIAGPKGHTKSLFRDCALDKVLQVVESPED